MPYRSDRRLIVGSATSGPRAALASVTDERRPNHKALGLSILGRPAGAASLAAPDLQQHSRRCGTEAAVDAHLSPNVEIHKQGAPSIRPTPNAKATTSPQPAC